MKVHKLLPLALIAAGAVAHADVTIATITAGKASIINVGGSSTHLIKGNRMRTESVMGGRTDSLLIDIDGRRFVSIDDTKKSAAITPLDAIRDQLDKVGVGSIHATLTKTTQTKQVAGYNCAVYDINVALPFSVTGSPGDGMDMNMLLAGTVCLSTDAPGLADYQRFYRAAADSGFIFGDPRATRSPTGAAQAKAYAQLTRKMAEAGMALESHVTISAGGSNPMASMMAKLAASDISATVSQITVGELPAERFEVPAGYKVKTQK
jgi:hypothetical protein